MGVSTVSGIVKETCAAIWDTLHELYMPIPSRSQWEDIADGYKRRWHFPHCCGAIDGKHCTINAPPHSGTMYFNYKRTFSIVLMALADSNCRFTMIDVGAAGSDGDSYIFRNSALGVQFMNNSLPLPKPKCLPGSKILAPFILVGDEAFPPKNTLLKPYSRRGLSDSDNMQYVFNYRLSRARMSVECAFGVLTQRSRCLSRKMFCTCDTAEAVVKAACVLHNFLLKEDSLALDVYHDMYRLGKKRNYCGTFKPFAPMRGYHPSQSIVEVRNIFASYFMATLGEVPWQYRCAHVEKPS